MLRREALMKLGLAGAGALLGGVGVVRAQGATQAGGARSGGDAGAQPGFYRFKIGALEAIAFNDGEMTRPVAQSPFGVGEPVEAIVAELREGFLPITHLRNQFNVLLVRIGSERVLIDTGGGAGMAPAAGKLVSRMAEAGVRPEDVTAVFLSHAHRDHFGGMLDAQTKEPVFRNATHFVGRKEFEFWTGSNPDVSTSPQPEEARKGMIAGARGALEALRGKWQFIEPGERLLDGLEIVDLAGHTPGHLGFLFSSGGEQLLHFVDAANHHVLSFAKPGWLTVFDVNPREAERTRRKLLDRAAADRLRVFGAHMPFPALGHVRARGGDDAKRDERGYEFVIEPWAMG